MVLFWHSSGYNIVNLTQEPLQTEPGGISVEHGFEVCDQARDNMILINSPQYSPEHLRETIRFNQRSCE